MRNVRLCLILGFAGTLAFSSTAAAQTSSPRNLSGVWIGKRDAKQVVDEKFRPPMTPWAQARFDAAVPTLGPRVIAGKENDPILRCNPDGIPKLLVSRSHSKSFRSRTGSSCSSNTIGIGARSGPTGENSPPIQIRHGWALPSEDGKEILSSSIRSASTTYLG